MKKSLLVVLIVLLGGGFIFPNPTIKLNIRAKFKIIKNRFELKGIKKGIAYFLRNEGFEIVELGENYLVSLENIEEKKNDTDQYTLKLKVHIFLPSQIRGNKSLAAGKLEVKYSANPVMNVDYIDFLKYIKEKEITIKKELVRDFFVSSSVAQKIKLLLKDLKKNQIVILKADDFVYSPLWIRFIKYVEEKGIKVSLGVVGEKLKEESFCNWIKNLSQKDNFEFWNHGLTHSCIKKIDEFKNIPYENQLISINETQRLLKEKCGIICHTFGAPCNAFSKYTSWALEDVDDIHVWFFSNIKNSSKFILPRMGEIEHPTLFPNYNYFIEKYNEYHLEDYNCITLQIHPGFWEDEESWKDFFKIMDFLFQKKVVFMNPYEYYQSITTTIMVSNTQNSGRGSLRDTLEKINKSKPDNTVILLPSGTYYLLKPNEKESELRITSDIIIRGAGAADTIIDGNNLGRVFHISAPKVLISGVTIRNGNANYGAGIKVNRGSLIIKDCIITENTFINRQKTQLDGCGIGLYAYNSRITIIGCRITCNTGDSAGNIKGGGICLNFSNDADIRNNLFGENIANKNLAGTGQGGGLYLTARSSDIKVNIVNNTFLDNIAAEYCLEDRGAIYLEEVKDAVLERNRVSQ